MNVRTLCFFPGAWCFFHQPQAKDGVPKFSHTAIFIQAILIAHGVGCGWWQIPTTGFETFGFTLGLSFAVIPPCGWCFFSPTTSEGWISKTADESISG